MGLLSDKMDADQCKPKPGMSRKNSSNDCPCVAIRVSDYSVGRS